MTVVAVFDALPAGHLRRAIELYGERLRADACRLPDGLAALLDGCLSGSGTVTKGQERSILADADRVSSSSPAMARVLLTLAEAGDALGGVSESTVKRLASSGALPTVRLGRARRVHRDDLEQFAAGLRNGRKKPAA